MTILFGFLGRLFGLFFGNVFIPCLSKKSVGLFIFTISIYSFAILVMLVNTTKHNGRMKINYSHINKTKHTLTKMGIERSA